MAEDQKAEISIDELLKHAVDKTDGQVTYANTMGVRVGENEVVLEFYFLIPSTTSQPVLLQRMVLPLKLGAQLAQMLSEGIEQIGQNVNSSPHASDLNP